jgi:hypothetical protein
MRGSGSVPSWLKRKCSIWLEPGTRGDLTDISSNGVSVQNGSTSGSDTNDGSFDKGFIVSGDDYCLSDALDITLQGNWFLGMNVISGGVVERTANLSSVFTLFSLALPDVEDGYVAVETQTPADESTDDVWRSVYLHVKNGATDTYSTESLLVERQHVRTLSLEAEGNVLTLSCEDTGDSITVTAARAEGNPRLCLGGLGKLTVSDFADGGTFKTVYVHDGSLANVNKFNYWCSRKWRTADSPQRIDQLRREFEQSLTDRVITLGASGFASEDERARWTDNMENMSNGLNTVKWVNDGAGIYFPTILVRIPQYRVCDVLQNSTDTSVHPAFIVNGVTKDCFYAGKYQAYSVTSNAKDIGLSLYGVDPKVYIDFDDSFSLCGNGGAGHHLITNAEWALISLLAKNINSYQPKGNNNYGRDYQDPDDLRYYGIPTYISSDKIARVGCGTGPVSWAHDGTPWGVYDLNGNLYEYVNGLRLGAGEIQVIANNDGADNSIDVSRDSALWKAIKASDGSLVTPETTFASDADTAPSLSGANATLKYDGTSPISIVTEITTRHTDSASSGNPFDDVSGTSLPEIASSLCVAPEVSGNNKHGGDYFYMRNQLSGSYSETLARRGGDWAYGSIRGVFYLDLGYDRSTGSSHFGARPAFVNLEE